MVERKDLESGSGTKNHISCSKSGNMSIMSIDIVYASKIGSDPFILDLRCIFELMLYL